jgi:hypothetical protein
MTPVVRIGGAVVAALVLAACGTPSDVETGRDRPLPATPWSSPTPASSAPTVAVPPQPGAACPDRGDRAFSRRLGSAEVTGYVRGTGRRVVVLSHQSRGTPCDLATLAHVLADAGFRVVSWTAGIGTNQATLARLVAAERKSGARYVALVGASAGGATSIGAAAVIRPRLDAVVALSPSNQSELFGDVVPSAARYAGPLMAVVGEGDSAFAPLVPELAAAHRGEEVMTVLPGVSEHGKSLVTSPDSPVTRAVLRFLQR